jgi:hypothetical protein
MVGYSTDPSKCRFEFHTGGGDANSTLCQWYDYRTQDDKELWRNIILNDDKTAFAKFSFGLNYMCNSDILMNHAVSNDDNINHQNNPADWYINFSNPESIAYLD